MIHGISSFTQTQNLVPLSTGVLGSTKVQPRVKCLNHHHYKTKLAPQIKINYKLLVWREREIKRRGDLQLRRADRARRKVVGPEPRRTRERLMKNPLSVRAFSASDKEEEAPTKEGS